MAVPGQVNAADGKASILVVDDQPGIRQLLCEVLQVGRWEVRAAANGREALEEIRRSSPLLAIIDLKMPGMNGLELLQEMRKRDFQGEAVILSAYSDTELLLQARELGVRYWMSKPFDLDEFQEMVTRAMHELEKRSGFLPS